MPYAQAAACAVLCCAPWLRRERAEASNFNAALYEHGQYLKRKRVAEARRKEFEEREQRECWGASGCIRSFGR